MCDNNCETCECESLLDEADYCDEFTDSNPIGIKPETFTNETQN